MRFQRSGTSVFYSYNCLSRRSPKSGGRDAGEVIFLFLELETHPSSGRTVSEMRSVRFRGVPTRSVFVLL